LRLPLIEPVSPSNPYLLTVLTELSRILNLKLSKNTPSKQKSLLYLLLSVYLFGLLVDPEDENSAFLRIVGKRLLYSLMYGAAFHEINSPSKALP
jgi:hypothetical protein